MIHKYHHRALSLLILASTSCAQITGAHEGRFDWPGSQTGECYPSTDAYIRAQYPWTADKPDDNILVRDASPNSQGYVWVIDNTTSINTPAVLIKNKEGNACIILSVINASSIDFHFGSNGSLPLNVVTEDTPPPGFPATHVTYTLDPLVLHYYPSKCEKILRNQSTVVDCASAFSE